MKKIKRILALTAVFLLVGMYALTLILAFTDNSASRGMFKASLACTALFPILLYGYVYVYQAMNKDDNPYLDSEESSGDESDETSAM